jgi:hypothetical protein
MGIKFILYRAHFAYLILKDDDYLMKIGYFNNICKDKIINIRKFDVQLQDFVPLKVEEGGNFKIGVGDLDFDAFLGNYSDYQIYG